MFLNLYEADFKRRADRDAFLRTLCCLRVQDIAEIKAVRGKFVTGVIADEIMRAAFKVWFVYQAPFHATPAAAFGLYKMTPTCAGVFAFGTNDWPLVVKGMTRRILRDIMPKALEWGFHRAECRALASRQDVRRWLEGLGWRAEAVLSEFGTRREDFILYAWTAPHEAHPHNQGEHQGLRQLSSCDA
jgi:hypothetical protein